MDQSNILFAENIQNLSTKFEAFSDSFYSQDYVVRIGMLTADFPKISPTVLQGFILQIFQAMCAAAPLNPEPQGTLDIISFAECTKEIRRALSCGGPHEFSVHAQINELTLAPEPLQQERELCFWKIAKANASLPPTYVYKHIPAPYSLFDETAYWQFCYLLFDERSRSCSVIWAYATADM